MDDLVSQHLNLANKIAKKYMRKFPTLADEVKAEAHYALVLAAKKCEKKDIDDTVVKYFSVYIKYHILHYLKRWTKVLKVTIPVVHFSLLDFFDETNDLLKAANMTDNEINIIRLKLEGHTSCEIAAAKGVSNATMTRNIQAIQEKWLAYIRRS